MTDPTQASAARCDHKFIDSTHCLKCGWMPPEASAARLTADEQDHRNRCCCHETDPHPPTCCATERHALLAQIDTLRSERDAARAALEAAKQFLDPDVPRGPASDGWQNTVMMVDAALKGSR